MIIAVKGKLNCGCPVVEYYYLNAPTGTTKNYKASLLSSFQSGVNSKCAKPRIDSVIDIINGALWLAGLLLRTLAYCIPHRPGCSYREQGNQSTMKDSETQL